MKIIGLTGGIGSGKSTVLNFFKNLGVATYIADVEAKKLLNSDPELILEIKKTFGKHAYKNSELNKKYISSIVFNDKIALKKLNELVHPKVRKDFEKFIKNSTSEIIIYEAAILFESGSHKLCDYIITVTANFEDRISRVMKRDNVSKQQVLNRIQHQLSDDEKIKKADFVIKNTTLKEVESQVNTIFKILIKLR